MKEFNEFLIKGLVKKQYPDKQRAKDIIELSNKQSKNLKRILEKIGLDEENAESIIQDCYDITLGIIRAKMLLKGFSASGQGAHEAEVSYLKNLNFQESDVQFVNQPRYFRNGILYYRKTFDEEYARKVLDFLEKFKKKVKSFYVTITGPLGVGKTKTAEALAKELNAKHISLDRTDSKLIEENLKCYVPVIIEVNGNDKLIIQDLREKFKDYKGYILRLKAKLQTCIKRDAKRKEPKGKDAVESDYTKTTSLGYEIIIDTEKKSIEEIIKEIKEIIR